MFSREIIIAINRKKLTVAAVDSSSVDKKYEKPWTNKDLVSQLAEIKKTFNVNKARLLLGDDISYVLQFEIPAETPTAQEREVVSEEIKEQVPEIIQDHDWDYKVVSTKNNTKKILAFVPVEDIFSLIKQSFEKNNITLEAIEPESVAKTRNADPLIGLSLKKDLSGKDANVLNLKIKNGNSKTTSPKSNSKGVLVILGIVGLLVLVTIAAYAYFSQSVNQPQPADTSITSAVSAAPKTTPTPSPLPTPSPEENVELDLDEYSVQVLNGTGIAGEAGVVETLLEEAGFSQITTGNADTFNTIETTIAISDTVTEKKQLFDIVKNALPSYTITEPVLNTRQEYVIIITVGEKNE